MDHFFDSKYKMLDWWLLNDLIQSMNMAASYAVWFCVHIFKICRNVLHLNQLLIGYAWICPGMNFHSSFPLGLPFILVKVNSYLPWLYKQYQVCFESISCLEFWRLIVCVYNSFVEGSVGVILNQQDNSIPLVDPSSTTKENALESPVLIKRQLNDDTLDSCHSSQADWIRQYVEQQEEVILPSDRNLINHERVIYD